MVKIVKHKLSCDGISSAFICITVTFFMFQSKTLNFDAFIKFPSRNI